MNFPKYIIVKADGFEQPVMFTNLMTHANVAHGFGGKSNVVAAGFFCVREDGTYKCWGESISLGVASRGTEDSAIMNRMMRDSL